MNNDALSIVDLEAGSNVVQPPPTPSTSHTGSIERDIKKKNSALRRFESYSLFFMQAFVSIAILAFCFGLIIGRSGMSGDEKNIYFMLIGVVMGFWIPTPKRPNSKS